MSHPLVNGMASASEPAAGFAHADVRGEKRVVRGSKKRRASEPEHAELQPRWSRCTSERGSARNINIYIYKAFCREMECRRRETMTNMNAFVRRSGSAAS